MPWGLITAEVNVLLLSKPLLVTARCTLHLVSGIIYGKIDHVSHSQPLFQNSSALLWSTAQSSMSYFQSEPQIPEPISQLL